MVVKENELKNVLQTLGRKPSLVITDSQVFAKVSADTPTDIPLTSFSILFARYKGNLDTLVNGARMLDRLQDGDTILISEGCTHHRQCDDIGTVKLPRWIREHTGKQLNFEFTSGTEFPAALDRFRMIIHCGGCMLNEREMKYRIRCAEDARSHHELRDSIAICRGFRAKHPDLPALTAHQMHVIWYGLQSQNWVFEKRQIRCMIENRKGFFL